LYFRFCELLSDAKIHNHCNRQEFYDNFKKKYMMFYMYSAESIKQSWSETRGLLLLPLMVDMSIIDKCITDYYFRKSMIWLNYLVCLTSNEQVYAIDFLERFKLDCLYAIRFVCKICHSNIQLPNKYIYNKITEMIEKTHKFTENFIHKNYLNNFDKNKFMMNNLKKSILCENPLIVYKIRKSIF